MVTLKINGQQVSVPEKTTIMEAAEKVGVHIPHLCFLKEINEIAACRVCLVELAGIDRLVTACNTECRNGLDVITNSPRLRKIRRMNVELILSDHKSECPSCSQERKLHIAVNSQRSWTAYEPVCYQHCGKKPLGQQSAADTGRFQMRQVYEVHTGM